MLLDFEKNREIEDWLLADVLYFCAHTDVCKTFGVSFLDIFFHMDIYTYTKLKEFVQKENERKALILEQEQRKQQARQQALLVQGQQHGKYRRR